MKANKGSAQRPHDTSALPVPYSLEARYGSGHDRALVLGGGGIFFIAWQVSYMHELATRGVDLAKASLITGTSAGSVVAAILAGGRLELARRQIAVLARVPTLVAAMAPAEDLRPSQTRALDLFRNATDADPDTIRHIGHAALAADAAPAGKIRRSVAGVLAMRKWPAPSLHIATVDTYTGERLVVRHDSGVSVAAAAAASSSVPGLFSPQPLVDRRCMDGGVSGTGTNGDLAVGARAVLVLSLGANAPKGEAMMTIAPDSVDTEVAAMRAAGGEVLVRGPLEMDLATLMDPASIPAAVAMGQEQAVSDAAAIAAIWGANTDV